MTLHDTVLCAPSYICCPPPSRQVTSSNPCSLPSEPAPSQSLGCPTHPHPAHPTRAEFLGVMRDKELTLRTDAYEVVLEQLGAGLA